MSQRLQQIAGPPRLVTGDAHDAVTEVVVDADNVGEHVMAVVVGVPPLRGQACHVPLPGGGVNFGIVHPIPLTVADIVAQLHVLDALGRGQCASSERPSGTGSADADHDTGGQIEAALNSDGALDVRAVLRAKRIFDVETDRVQFDGKCFDIRGAQVSVFTYVCDGHQFFTGRSTECRAGNGFVAGAGVPVTVHVGRFRIVNFLAKITEVPGGERSLSRCRCGGRRFRAGWAVNHGQSTDGWGQARVMSVVALRGGKSPSPEPGFWGTLELWLLTSPRPASSPAETDPVSKAWPPEHSSCGSRSWAALRRCLDDIVIEV